jgi:hypothetical protein
MKILEKIENWTSLILIILMGNVLLASSWCIYTVWATSDSYEQADQPLETYVQDIERTFDPLYLYDDEIRTGLDRRLANKDQLIIELDSRISELEDKLVDLRVETAKLSGSRSQTPLLEGVMNTALEFGLDKWLAVNKEEN